MVHDKAGRLVPISMTTQRLPEAERARLGVQMPAPVSDRIKSSRRLAQADGRSRQGARGARDFESQPSLHLRAVRVGSPKPTASMICAKIRDIRALLSKLPLR
jgi:hypothetical protein